MAVPPPAQDDQPSLYPLRPGQVAREPRPDSSWPRNTVRLRQARQLSPTDQVRLCGTRPGAPSRRGGAGRSSRTHLTGPPGTALPRADSSTAEQPVQALVPPHDHGRSAAPPAKGGHVRSSAPTSSPAVTAFRPSPGPAAPCLLLRRGGAGHRPINGCALRPGPLPHPQPRPSGRGCRGDCLARRQEVDVNGANARGP